MKLQLILASLLLISSMIAFGADKDKVVIISPHRKSIQNEYVPAFKSWYLSKYKNDVDVEWLDQGGSNDDVKFLKSKFSSNAKTSGIDIFWGGGSTTHSEIANLKFSDTLNLTPEIKKQVPQNIGGVALGNKENTYIAQAASTFGIFFNKSLLKIESLPEPTTWESLSNPKYKDKIILTDARKSGTASVMNHVILESLGWDNGMALLTSMAGNAKQITQSSSDVIKSVISSDAAITLTIDFYALPKIADLGADKLGFALPEGKTIIEGDPITILKGAPHRMVADRFVEFALSVDGQKILVLPKGAPGGPKLETLGRLAVNAEAYKQTEGKRVNPLNPFTAKGFLKYDSEKEAKTRAVLDDLIGSQLVDSHKNLREAWGRVVKDGFKPGDLAALSKMPIIKDDLAVLSVKWSDPVFRNQTMNAWVKFAQDKYTKVAVSK